MFKVQTQLVQVSFTNFNPSLNTWYPVTTDRSGPVALLSSSYAMIGLLLDDPSNTVFPDINGSLTMAEALGYGHTINAVCLDPTFDRAQEAIPLTAALPGSALV
jgi:hypothetical protein